MKTAALILVLAVGVYPATYKGQSIDGRKFEAVVKHAKVIDSARVSFDGRYITIYLDKRTVTAKMPGEAIENPREILADDGAETWVIDAEL